jgi:mRNA interferase MazF
VVRGDVHKINVPHGRGREQHGRRLAVIVQADDLLGLSTVVVCLTSQSARPASFHPEVSLADEKTRVLCEMIRSIDALKLGNRVGHLTRDELVGVDEALELVLDLA